MSSSLCHTHYLDYTSTHEPLAPTSFSIVRQSCLRTLSCETLPPSSNISSAPNISPSFTSNPFSSTAVYPSSATGTSSGGPILFGDPLAGYTTAYIFRIPDPTARGRRRVYALMAISTHHQRQAMQAFSFLSVAFRDLAAWIQGLAEQELERADTSPTSPSRLNGDEPTNTNTNGNGHSSVRRGSTASSSTPPSTAPHTPTSSFLSWRSRGPDGRFSGMSPRARGLAELVGLPDFFLELHARFVRLLVELGVLLGA